MKLVKHVKGQEEFSNNVVIIGLEEFSSLELKNYTDLPCEWIYIVHALI